MKWTFVIARKLQAALALAIVFVLVVATNMMDTRHFTELQESFSSVYKDRLLVESYIYKLYRQLEKKKPLFENTTTENNLAEKEKKNEALNDSIQSLINYYENTKLTVAEAKYFNNLKSSLNSLYQLEKSCFQSPHQNNKVVTKIMNQHQKLIYNLDRLSDIQLSESKKIIEKSKRTVAATNITSQLEVVILLVIGIIVQALVFASKALEPKLPRDSKLN